MQLSLIVPEIIVALVAMIVLMGELFVSEDSKRILGIIAALGPFLAIIQVLNIYNLQRGIFHQLLVIDPISNLIKIIILLSTSLIILLSIDYPQIQVVGKGEYYSLMLFSVVGMMCMVSSNDFITFFLSLQLTSIPLYILSGIDKNNARSNEAAFKYLMLGMLASVVMLYGMSMVYGFTASTRFEQIAQGLPVENFSQHPALVMAMFFIFAGFAFKIAAVPFHFWVPDTYEGAPTPVTTFLATAPKVAGFAALLRFVTTAFYPLISQWRLLFIILSVLSMFVGNIVALSQTNIKRMLGFSSVAHVGYILMTFAVADRYAFSSTIFYIMIYGIINIGAFAVVAAVSSGDYHIDKIARRCRKSPLMSLSLGVFLISMIGIPPTPGFWGKFYVFASAVHKGMTWLAIIGIINSAISVYYYINVLRYVYVEGREGGSNLQEGDVGLLKAPFLMKWVVGICLIITLIITLYPQPFIEIARSAALILKI
ncbi:MAG: NADH-quinone oxidoreductase subunit N [bacterium]